MSAVVFNKDLTGPDVVVLRSLAQDIEDGDQEKSGSAGDAIPEANASEPSAARDQEAVKVLTARNDPADPQFLPTVFNSVDVETLQLPKWLDARVLRPYIRFAQSVVRVKADVVMLNHLLLYAFTSVPSAAMLFYHFTWPHALVHIVMQFTYMGSYTLMMHQHIHGRGILAKRFSLIDTCFPYLLDPLMGHTWNGYYYHHVKHHHVEGNGPNDLSSTIRFQRDDPLHFLYYLGRFFFLVWLDLPLYFARKGRYVLGLKAAFWEFSTLAFIGTLYRFNPSATTVVYLMPLLLLRIGLMIGNWGQHAFVDHDEPDSDYRSSVTLIDVASNRHCFNDGYHTSHHLNPLRHWRDHPVSFMKGKDLYASQHALVFHDIDYVMITVRLLMKDYQTLARCMVPIGKQIGMSMDERIVLLKGATQRFTEEEIRDKFGNKST